MSALSLKLAEQTERHIADLNDTELERIEGVVSRYGEALNERMRVVSAMRSAAVTQDETAYRKAERRLHGIREEMEDCSLELNHPS